MFGFDVKRKANKVMNLITDFSNRIINNRKVYPFGGGNQEDVECILTGLSCFLASGFANNDNLAYELVPAYQKKIMPSVTELQYNLRTELLQRYYLEFRETAIRYQENGGDWFYPLMEEFSHMIAEYLDIQNASDDCYGVFGACIVTLIERLKSL